ncbi:hypothetical protein LXL04_006112 [Taraxacum kok-saghyz]
MGCGAVTAKMKVSSGTETSWMSGFNSSGIRSFNRFSTADVSISQGLGKTDLDIDNDKGFEVLIHLNSFESKSGQMEEAGTNGRLPVDKWKCLEQMDKSNHSKPTRVVGRGRDNFDSIVPDGDDDAFMFLIGVQLNEDEDGCSRMLLG